jgi:hypothetical protein
MYKRNAACNPQKGFKKRRTQKGLEEEPTIEPTTTTKMKEE